MKDLSFEQPIIALQEKIDVLKNTSIENDGIDLTQELKKLEDKKVELIKKIFSNLTAWNIVEIARHQDRPYTQDYLDNIADEFIELHGDRSFGDDSSIISGLAKIDGNPFVIIGHQKGRELKEKMSRNFGMPRPEGYRKAQRMMKLAERFSLPILTLIDTPGAYPGIDAEERGQSEAIASCLEMLSNLRTQVIVTIIGEGGSGGALAIGIGDSVLMMQYATYSVISPEGCASILWKDASNASTAAEAMKITSSDLLKFKLIDDVIPEPLGGAHKNTIVTALSLKTKVMEQYNAIKNIELDELVERRYQRLRSYTALTQN